MSRVSSFRSRRIQEKRRKSFLYKYIGGIVFLIVAVLGLSLLSRAEFARVEKVVIEGNVLINEKAIGQVVDETLNSKYFHLFSKNNFALYPRSEVEEKIRRQFAAVGAAKVSFDGANVLSVKILEHEPAYLWCDSPARAHCYFMDNKGFIFSESADFSENVLFTFYGLVDPSQPVGKNFMPESRFAGLNNFIDSFKLLKLSPVGLNARSEEDFELLLSTGGSVLFSDKEDYLTTFENLETIIAEQARNKADFLSTLDYIDVRFESKAFVKLK